jgi:hypothetical protein
MTSNDNNTMCERCLKVKDSVRFEGSQDGFFCDGCIYEIEVERRDD